MYFSLTSAIPLSMQQAVEQGRESILLLMFVLIPLCVTALCIVLESVLGSALFKAPKGKIIKTAILSNIVGFTLLVIGCALVYALLVYLNTKTKLPLWVAAAYILPVMLAIGVKIAMFRSRLPKQSPAVRKSIFFLSHLLALAAFFYAYHTHLPA